MWMLAAVLAISGLTTLTSCSSDGATILFNIDGDQQPVNTGTITAPVTLSTIRMRLAGKIE